MIFNEIKCHVNTFFGLVGGMHPPCVRAWTFDRRLANARAPVFAIYISLHLNI